MPVRAKDLTAYVQRRLVAIQGRHNFDPRAGGRQVARLPDLAKAYGEFRQLLGLIDKFGLGVRVPFDAAGLRPSARKSERRRRPVHVYFASKNGTSFWKIGSSVLPTRRLREILLGNEGTLHLRHIIKDGGRALERRLHQSLRKWKTRDRNHPTRGEWYSLDSEYVRRLSSSLDKDKIRIPLPNRVKTR